MFFSDDNFIRLERAQSLAKKLGTTANNIALASILNHKFPSYAIVGPRNVEQIRASCASNAIELTDEQVKWLEGEDLIS